MADVALVSHGSEVDVNLVRAVSVRRKLHLLLLARQGQGTLTMNHLIRTAAALAGLMLLPSIASAELRRVQLNVLGMD